VPHLFSCSDELLEVKAGRRTLILSSYNTRSKSDIALLAVPSTNVYENTKLPYGIEVI
jgi:hypothetical protein